MNQTLLSSFGTPFERVENALAALREGRGVMVLDDEDRENEGDFICAAEFATTENINFMATHGKGLICMPMSEAFVRKLQFPQMVQNNTDNHETAFTVSIDHISTSTGISAAERSVTAMACVEEGARAEDFRRPGHMFPLLSKKNGVLEREGHTEATVDLCRLAGLKECGLCCEIMREDGTMMRTAELMTLAERFGIKFITIRDLQAYRKCHEKLVDQVTAVNMPTKYGDFKAYGFVSRLNGEHHVALVKGDIGDGKDVLCRVHSECLTGDTFGSLRCDCGQQLAAAMTQIENEGRGILLYMRQEGRGIGLINVAKLFGMGAIKGENVIDLVINIVPWSNHEIYDRLGLDEQCIDILGVKVPQITIPITPGRNLAVILEAAAMNNRQKKMGYNAAYELLSALGMDASMMPHEEIKRDLDI